MAVGNCNDCGVAVGKPGIGRPPLRCVPCWEKERSKPKPVQYKTVECFCDGCGSSIFRKPTVGRKPRWCAECNPRKATVVQNQCVKCGASFTQQLRRGKPFKNCVACRYKPKTKIERQCGFCGKTFTATEKGRGKYCSRGCLEHAKRQAIKSEIPPRTCAVCGAAFLTYLTKRRKHCSQQCEHVSTASNIAKRKAWYKETERRRLDVEGPKRTPVFRCSLCETWHKGNPKTKRCNCCAKKVAAQKQIEYSKKKHAQKGILRECRECGTAFVLVYGVKNRLFCSEKCGLKNSNRSGKATRRARLRAVTVKTFDPISIFNRDAWRCKLCGTKTPRNLRGSTSPRAPELGHIVALADGGAHVPENVQCECRACNAAKGVRAMGQLMLAGFGDLPKTMGRSRTSPS